MKSGSYSKPEILEKRLHHSIALTQRKGRFSSLTSMKDPSGTEDRQSQGVEFRGGVTVLIPNFIPSPEKKERKTTTVAARVRGRGRAGSLNQGGVVPTGFAAGGAVDTVPALLTPGEFVVNKEASQRIGYSKLNAMNKYARGGPVQKFRGGGPSLPIIGAGGPGQPVKMSFNKSFVPIEDVKASAKGLPKRHKKLVVIYWEWHLLLLPYRKAS